MNCDVVNGQEMDNVQNGKGKMLKLSKILKVAEINKVVILSISVNWIYLSFKVFSFKLKINLNIQLPSDAFFKRMKVHAHRFIPIFSATCRQVDDVTVSGAEEWTTDRPLQSRWWRSIGHVKNRDTFCVDKLLVRPSRTYCCHHNEVEERIIIF